MSYTRHQKTKERNNRIKFITAIVFLMVMVCGFQLYKLQIDKHDYFSALASDQQQVYSELSPTRGEIFIKNRGKGEDKLYSLATNKDFALVYAIPKDVDEPSKMAEKLYTFFDQEKVEKEVKEFYEEEDEKELKWELDKIHPDTSEEKRENRAEEIKRNIKTRRQTAQWKEEREKDIKEEIEIRKGKIIDDYEEMLSKENDPYEPIEKKMEKEKLKRMYEFLWPEEKEKEFAYEDLFIENGRVYYRRDGERKKVALDGISHMIKEHRYYPEDDVGSNFMGFVGSDDSSRGNYGLEGFFDRELAGEHGFIKSGTKGGEDTIRLNNKEYKNPKDGSDLVLSIDRAVQFYVCKQLEKAVEKHGAEGGSVVVADPQTGGMIAMCSYPSFNPNKYSQVDDIDVYNNSIIFEDYEPGSVFKTITMGAALDKGAVSPNTTYEDKGKIDIDEWTIKNSDYSTHGPHGVVDMNYVLSRSLNTGAIFAMEQTGPNIFADYVEKFNFGSKTGIELEGESGGDIKNLGRDRVPEIYAATASYGQGMTATPLQLVMSYAAIANDGILMKPYIVKKIISGENKEEVTKPVEVRQVISKEAATLLSGMLVNVIESGHAEEAGVDGYYVGGKTGTAQVASEEGGYGQKTIHTFIGSAPIENSKFTMLVKLEDPKDVKYSASSAAPLFGKLADFMLSYYQIPKER